MAKKIQDLLIVNKQQLNNEFFVFELSGADDISDFKPGQFVQVKVEGSPETFLRRPFSIHDIDYQKNTFKLLIQISGKGSEALSRLKENDFLNIVYPLGKSFSLPQDFERVLLAGGGCGVAPLLFLGRYLQLHSFQPDILMGFRSGGLLIEYDEYAKLGEVFIITEDGTAGEKGIITSHSILGKRNYDRIYCCGPESMMRSLADFSRKKNIICEVSLENLMACGIGVCLCCVVDTNKGNVCTCTDGPVFNINDLKW